MWRVILILEAHASRLHSPHPSKFPDKIHLDYYINIFNLCCFTAVLYKSLANLIYWSNKASLISDRFVLKLSHIFVYSIGIFYWMWDEQCGLSQR